MLTAALSINAMQAILFMMILFRVGHEVSSQNGGMAEWLMVDG
jgi:hypothetical protein